jgi:CRISPR-associated endonuclease Cas1
VTLFGYGISIRVDRGHLVVEDGIGSDRYCGRFPRVGHGLQRLVTIGDGGCVSLAALRWLADQDAAFVMLERDGSVLAVTGPVAASDARIRRAQACLIYSDAVVPIVCELINSKLASQQRVARERLQDEELAKQIARYAAQLPAVNTLGEIRQIEARSSAAYWFAWRFLSAEFPQSELNRVPNHWRTFGSRTSPISNRPKKAANPANAILNYLYAILEAEARLALAALGLDPGLGLLHMDTPTRDSLACDLMEPVRPRVEDYVLRFLARSPLKREWFFEQRDGTCRIMPELASQLGETAPIWRQEIEPYAEWIANAIRSTSPGYGHLSGPRTRLTRQRWREAVRRERAPSEATPVPPTKQTPSMENTIHRTAERPAFLDASHTQRKGAAGLNQAAVLASLSFDAIARKRESNRKQYVAAAAWNPARHPAWLTRDVYLSQVQTKLIECTQPAIAAAIRVSERYAGKVRDGNCVPHKRHWLKLAELAGCSPGE